MQTKARRFNVEKLFVLGAGASYAATQPNKFKRFDLPPIKQTPLDKNFTAVMSKLNVENAGWVNDSVRLILSNWKDQKPFGKCGLEEAIQAHAANLKFINAIKPRRKGRNDPEFEEYVRHLVHLIVFQLRRCREGSQKLYSEFADLFFGDLETANRIITFNYDDVLDKTLRAKNHALQNLYFPTLKPSQAAEPVSGGSDAPLLLKLHGSINWNCSREDFMNVLMSSGEAKAPHWIENIWLKETGCPRPNDDAAPCIIPPIESKPVTSIRLFSYLWMRACEYLYECRELYVCGYSLPRTDALAFALFKEFKNDRLQTITVIDPDPSIMARWRELLPKEKVNNARWVYFSDFGDFIEAAK